MGRKQKSEQPSDSEQERVRVLVQLRASRATLIWNRILSKTNLPSIAPYLLNMTGSKKSRRKHDAKKNVLPFRSSSLTEKDDQ